MWSSSRVGVRYEAIILGGNILGLAPDLRTTGSFLPSSLTLFWQAAVNKGHWCWKKSKKKLITTNRLKAKRHSYTVVLPYLLFSCFEYLKPNLNTATSLIRLNMLIHVEVRDLNCTFCLIIEINIILNQL